MRAEFVALDWPAIAALLGASRVDWATGRRAGAELSIVLPARPEVGRGEPRRLLISDNGGEVNLSWILGRHTDNGPGHRYGDRHLEPAIEGSVAYVSWGDLVGPLTMAGRLSDALEGREIAYDDLDAAIQGQPTDMERRALSAMDAGPALAGIEFAGITAGACVRQGWAEEIADRPGLYRITARGRELLARGRA